MDQTIARLVERAIQQEVERNCYGCQTDRLSQKDHDICLGLTPYQQTENYFDTAWARINFKELTDAFKESFRLNLLRTAEIDRDTDKFQDKTPSKFYLENPQNHE